MERGPRVAIVDTTAAARLLDRLMGVPHAVRAHAPLRHARHLAQVWGVALAQAGRATLFGADAGPVLALVPADRKVSAPRLRGLLGATDLRVLRGDRGVGRVGWAGLAGEPGALPAVPEMYDAECWVDERVLTLTQIVVTVEPTRSVALAPADYVRLTDARVAAFTGRTRLLDEGGMVLEVVGRDGFEPS